MEASIKKENHLLKTYHRVFEKIKNELLEAKKSYESVDKQSMIDDRLLKYASDIKFYR